MTTLERGRVAFIGAVHEARPALDALLASDLVDVVTVVTSTEEGARKRAGAVDLATPARAARVPVTLSDNANDALVVAGVRAMAPDLLVVVGWNQLIKPEMLSVPRRGCVGFHASLLPRHRGHAPVNWAILRGENTIGNTMMMLDPGADTGDILAQRAIHIGPEDTCSSVYQQVGQAGADMLVELLPALLAGTVERRLQPEAADVLPRRTAAMGIIDWDRPARGVHDWVRALTVPYPGAFAMLAGRRVMIWATRLPADDEPTGPAGMMLDVTRDGVRIGVGAGSIVVTCMSEDGHRPEPASRWFRRAKLTVGARFDPVPDDLARWARGEGPLPAVAG